MGFIFGVLSGILWSVDTTIIYYVTFNAIIVAIFHDLFSFFIMCFFVSIKRIFCILLNNRVSIFFLLVIGVLGGPIGMGSYILCIKYSEPSFAAVISSLYPIVSVILANIILEQKLKPIGIVGILIAILGTVLISIFEIRLENITFLSFVFGVICAISWGAECIIVNFIIKNYNIVPKDIFFIRQFISSFAYLIVVLPIFLYFFDFNLSIVSDFKIFILFLAALFGTISFLFYYYAIEKIGALKAMGLNISYSAWSVLLSYMIISSQSIFLLLVSFLIIIGCVLTNI